jgi:hypothetical protein
MSSKLLINEPALQVLPSLAVAIGINEAIVLQQIHYWLEINRKADKHFIDGRYWTYNTMEEWQKQFPWLSLSTLKRVVGNLEKLSLLPSAKFNAKDWNHTKWYTIDYDALRKLEESLETPDKFDWFKLNQSKGSKRTDQSVQSEPISYTETNNREYKTKNRNIEKRIGANSLCDGSFSDFQSSNRCKEPKSTETVETFEQTATAQSSSKTERSKESAARETHETQKKTVKQKDEKEQWSYDGDGWLQLPESWKYKKVLWITVRRMSYLLAFDWMDEAAEPITDDDGEVEREGNQIMVKLLLDGEDVTEEEAFGKNGELPLRKLRDIGASDSPGRNMSSFTQDEFNDKLQELFYSSLEWCQKHGSNVTSILKRWSVFDIFYAQDSGQMQDAG